MFALMLCWSDVAPSRRVRFDPAGARRAAGGPILAAPREVDREVLAASIDRALLAEYGAWVTGWRWSASEEGNGGPVHGWCCARHDLLREDDTDAGASVDRVVVAVMDWHTFLVELETMFRGLPGARGDEDRGALADHIELAAARLLPVILERTRTEDAWYHALAKALTWYAESRGHDASVVEPIIDRAIGGSFTSWVEPSTEVAVRTFAAIASGLRTDLPATRDATAVWTLLRMHAFDYHGDSPLRERVATDGHRRYIAGRERARDPVRADAMEVALDACRQSAAADEELTFDRLARWQSIVLERPVTFRATDAFAKEGRERYPFTPESKRRFELHLLEANGEGTPVAIRAARVYLDICFHHPFEDGNARAARLALDHVLMRSGLALHTVEPLFVVSRAATDAYGARTFALLVDHLAGWIARDG